MIKKNQNEENQIMLTEYHLNDEFYTNQIAIDIRGQLCIHKCGRRQGILSN